MPEEYTPSEEEINHSNQKEKNYPSIQPHQDNSLEAEISNANQKVSQVIQEQLNINHGVSLENLTGEQERCIRGLLQLVSNSHQLLATPRLPASYIPPGEERKREPRYTPRTINYNAQWHTIENPEELDNWATESGFLTLEDIYRDVPFETILQVLQPIPKLRERIENARYNGKVSIKSVIEKIRMSVTSQVYAEMIVQEGHKLINRHLSQYEPQENYIVVGVPGYVAAQGENGEYFGKINGQHILFINTPADPYLQLSDIRSLEKQMPLLPIIGAHELMHQSHSEKVEGGLAFQVDNGPSTQFITSNKRSEIVKHLHGPDIDTSDESVNFSVENAVIEGIAISAELYIEFKERNRLRELGKHEESERFNRSIKARIKILKNSEITGEGEHYAVGTYQIVRKLYQELNIDDIGEFLISVDLDAARKITKGSPEYGQIIENPKLIPQLKK